MAIRHISAPRPHVALVCAFVVELEAHTLLQFVRLRVVCIGSAECSILIKCVLCANRPDIGLVLRRAVLIVKGCALECLAGEMTIGDAALHELAGAVAEFDALIVGGFVRRCSNILIGIVKVPAARFCKYRPLVTIGDLCTREEIIDNDPLIGIRGDRHLTELDMELAVVAVRIRIGKDDIVALIRLHITRSRQTRFDMPMIVDLRRREEAQLELILVCFLSDLCVVLVVVTTAPITITQFARPLHHIRVALEVGDANAEVVELVCELGGKAVDECAIRCGHITLCHCLCNHLRHLIARDVAVTAERAVTVALDNAVRCELRHGVICPVVTGHVGEGVRRCERGRCRADRERCRESCCQSLLHGNSSLRDVPAVKEQS